MLVHSHVICVVNAAKPTVPPSLMPTVSPIAPSMSPVMPTATPIDMMHYFLPGITLSMNNSAKFCSDLCNSDLASIHSQSQLNDAVHTIHVRPKHIWAVTQHQRDEVYIGLTSEDWPSIPFTWKDGSPFNYGNDTSKSSAPWKHDHPQGDYAPTCVVLEADTSTWRDVRCDHTTTDRFLCNHCNSKIHKYAVLTHNTSGLTYEQSNAACLAMYGTSLASIHSDRDLSELISLLELNHRSIAWIGLSHDNTGFPVWEDGTPFDYGAYNSPFNFACFAIQDTDTALWQNKPCTDSYASVCSLPSEISFDLNTWTVARGDWSYDALNMHLIHPISASDAEIVILNKQWFNGNDPLWIELGFSISEMPSLSSWYGINLFHDAGCRWYFIGLYISTTGYYSTQIWRGDLSDIFSLSDIEIATGPNIAEEFANEMFFTLRIRITIDHLFDVWVNNNKHISHLDRVGDPSTYRAAHGYSGYIDIESDNAASRTRSLYISGTPETVAPLSIYAPESTCWGLLPPPTSPPAQNPTSQTQNPAESTSTPSNDPISQTQNPTSVPSQNPNLPTTNPSALPTLDTTSNPTEYPTVRDPTGQTPSNNPTSTPPSESPTKYETSNPTFGPSNNPTDIPSKLSTLSPTNNPVSFTTSQTQNPTLVPSTSTTVMRPTTTPIYATSLTSTAYVTLMTEDQNAGNIQKSGDADIWTQLTVIMGLVLSLFVIGYCCYHLYRRSKKQTDAHHDMIGMTVKKEHDVISSREFTEDNNNSIAAVITEVRLETANNIESNEPNEPNEADGESDALTSDSDNESMYDGAVSPSAVDVVTTQGPPVEVQDDGEGEDVNETGNSEQALAYNNEGIDHDIIKDKVISTADIGSSIPNVAEDNHEESSTFSVEQEKECNEEMIIKEKPTIGTDGQVIVKCKLPPQNRTEGGWL